MLQIDLQELSKYRVRQHFKVIFQIFWGGF